MVNIDEYTREVTCEYKGELYSVRDNGAVLRHAREGKPTRPISAYQSLLPKEPTKSFEEWLGNHDIKQVQSNTSECFTNPMVYDFEKEQSASEIISTDHLTSQDEQIEEEDEWDKKEVFYKEKNESLTPGALQMHFYEKMSFPLCPKDTNGGLDSYADNLSIGKVVARAENGEECIILSWGWTLKLDAIQIEFQQEELPYWMYITLDGEKYFHFKYYYAETCRFCGSPYVLQFGGKTLCDFPLCPKDGNITLEEYADLLQRDVIFEKNQYGNYCVIDREIVRNEGEEPYLLVALSAPNEIKPYGDARVYVKNGKVIHKIEKCYFDYNTLQRRFCTIRGQEWTGEDTIDDYC